MQKFSITIGQCAAVASVLGRHRKHALWCLQMKNKIEPSGQSYKGYTIVNYDSRVVPDWKTLHITTLGL